MSSNQKKEPFVSKKRSASLDNAPEDVTHVVVNFIREGAEIEGSFEEKRKARSIRDSTLRAAAMSCKNAYEVYLPCLLQDITASHMNFLGLLRLMKRRGSVYGGLVKTLRFEVTPSLKIEAMMDVFQMDLELESISSLPTSADPETRRDEGLELGVQQFYDYLPNVEVLIIEHYPFFFYFQKRVGKVLVPANIVLSVKKLFISGWDSWGRKYNLSGRNALWLLVFCPQLNECSLSVDFVSKDLKFLVDHSDTFTGLSSVTKLALSVGFHFKAKNPKTWWGLPSEVNEDWKGGSKKTESVYRLLLSTIRLTALELNSFPHEIRDEDQSRPRIACLSALHRSFESLKHLRLLGMTGGVRDPSLSLCSSFKALRILTLEGHALLYFRSRKEVILPSSLELIFLIHYSEEKTRGALEDGMLLQVVLDRFILLPNLKEIIVPDLIGHDGKPIQISKMPGWKAKRKELEMHPVFRRGVIQLRKVKVGETVGEDAKGEVFLSTIPWVSS